MARRDNVLGVRHSGGGGEGKESEYDKLLVKNHQINVAGIIFGCNSYTVILSLNINEKDNYYWKFAKHE